MEQPKPDQDIRREMQIAAYKHDISKALKVEDLVKFYLEAGTDPAYLAHRFQVSLERCQRYVAALKHQQEKRRERENAMRGNQEASQVGPVVDGSGGAAEVRVDETRGADLGPEETGRAHRQANG